jgi:NAD(P)-dependent dehydrogenase (short-subunit alcohol dehydrogenase family)
VSSTTFNLGGKVAEGFGGPATIVVNNSGVTASHAALDLDPGDWDKVMDTNVKGAWLVARAAARRMIDAGVGGSVVNIASILGFRVAGRVAPYAASKAGLLHLTRALAFEWTRHGIRVNALAPGYIETDLNRDFFASDPGKALIARIPQRRLGRPEDLDGALLLLASNASAYMTGKSGSRPG